MSELTGETLVWVSYDRGQVFSAALEGMLASALEGSCRLQLHLVSSAEDCPGLVEQHRAGLVTLVLAQDDEVAAMRVLRRLQLRSPNCVRCVYYPLNLTLEEIRLREAGAQIVAQQIPWMQKQLPNILALAPRRSGGNHPLTSGLVDRLPWKEA